MVLDYSNWRNFVKVIGKAREVCENSGHGALDHFVEADQMVTLGSGAQRRIEDFHLSRYACYLIVQNDDPEKPIVALGQTYFAAQTRQAELAEDAERVYLRDQVSEHNKTLAASTYEVGVVSSKWESLARVTLPSSPTTATWASIMASGRVISPPEKG